MTRIAASLAALLACSTASAGEIKIYGFTIPDTVEIGGTTLRLNGAGVRQAMMWSGVQGVYVGALYLTSPSSDPAAILAADSPWVVRSYTIQGFDRQTTMRAIREGFELNSREKLKELLPLLERLAPAIPDPTKGGQVIVYAYQPGKGLTAGPEGGTQVTVEGKELANALLRNWLGSRPTDPELKKKMLGL